MTDSELVHLAGFKKLSEIYLRKSRVTALGIEKLQASRPELTVFG